MAAPSEEWDLATIVSRPDFEIITTLAYSTDFASRLNQETKSSPADFCFALHYRLDRLAAAIDFSLPDVISDLKQPDRLFSLAAEIETHMLAEHPERRFDASKLFIIRLAYGKSGKLSIASGLRPKYVDAQYYIRSLHKVTPTMGEVNTTPVISIHLDTGFVIPSLFTKHKTTFRDEYTAARARVGLTPSTPITGGKILLRNNQGEIIGGGFTTAYFLREGTYITPSTMSGAKAGVSRRWALEHAGVKEGSILAEDIRYGEMIWLSSAAGGLLGVMSKGSNSNQANSDSAPL